MPIVYFKFKQIVVLSFQKMEINWIFKNIYRSHPQNIQYKKDDSHVIVCHDFLRKSKKNCGKHFALIILFIPFNSPPKKKVTNNAQHKIIIKRRPANGANMSKWLLMILTWKSQFYFHFVIIKHCFRVLAEVLVGGLINI